MLIKALACVDHNKLWKILKEMGIPEHLTCLLRNLYVGQDARVRIGHGKTDCFLIQKEYISSVQFSCSVVSDPLPSHGLQQARPACPLTPRVYSNSCPLSWRCHPTISSSVIPFSSCLQSFPALAFFQMSQFFASSGQIIGVLASTSVPPMNTQDYSPLGWSGWISLQSKGLSRVFSNTTVQKHQFFTVQLSL